MIIRIAKYFLMSSTIFILFGLVQVGKGESPIPNIHIGVHKGVTAFFEKKTVKEIKVESGDVDISRNSSFFFSSVATGSFLNQVILLLMPILLGNNVTRKRKIPLYFILTGGIALWFATYSRAAWVILIFCIGIMVSIRRKKKEIIAFAIMAFIMIIVGIATPGIRYRFIDIFSTTQRSNVAHFKLWKEAAINFANHPLMGTGAGSSTEPLRAEEKEKGSDKKFSGRWVHNMLLQVAAETGIIGGMTILLFFLCILFQQWQAMKLKEASLFYDIMQGLVLGMFSLMLINLTLNVFYKIIFWVSLAVSYAATNVCLFEARSHINSVQNQNES
jgi:O-antigen ligase